MAILDNMSDTVRKIFLAGVGAVATTAEKSSELVADLIKKGEITVDQGKVLNEDLKRKFSDMGKDGEVALLKARLKNMTPQERSAYIAKISKIKDELDAEPVEVEVQADEKKDTAESSKDSEE